MSRIHAALAALTVCALLLAALAGHALTGPAKPQTTVVRPGLAYRAAVALQASYNTQQATLGIPIRIIGIGTVGCKVTHRISPTAANVVCNLRAVGPRSSATGGCAQVVGVYYDRLAGFAESTFVNEPCPDGTFAN